MPLCRAKHAHLIVSAFEIVELVVRADLDDPTVGDDADGIGTLER